jgi:hypothetical protein
MYSIKIPGRKEADPDRDKLNVVIMPYRLDTDFLDVTLRIELDPNVEVEYKALSELNTDGENLVFNYLVKADLSAVRQALDDLLTQAYQDPRWDKLLEEPLQKMDIIELKHLLAPIAEKGASVYYRIFESNDITPLSSSPKNAGIARAAILSALHRVGIIAITRKGELDVTGRPKAVDPLFPWAFMYTDTDFRKERPELLEVEYFWGFRYEIQELFDFTSISKKLPVPAKMTAAICPIEDQNRHYANDHPFMKYPNQVHITQTPSTDAFGNALKNFTSDCLYFYGHAFHPNPPERTQSWLKLENEELTVDWLERHYDAPRFESEPIVTFLNGCKTAPLNKWDDESIFGFFCRRGNRNLCCVATVAPIPRLFAFEFGKHFWEGFLTQQYIGRALLDARWEMLNQYNNPLGLLYSLFGCVDTRLTPAITS